MRARRLLFTIILGLMLFAPSGADSEEIKAFVRRYFEEVVNKGNLDALTDFIAPTYIGRQVGTPELKVLKTSSDASPRSALLSPTCT